MMLSMDLDNGNIYEQPSVNSTAHNQGSSTTYEESQGSRGKGMYPELQLISILHGVDDHVPNLCKCCTIDNFFWAPSGLIVATWQYFYLGAGHLVYNFVKTASMAMSNASGVAGNLVL